MSLTKDNLVVLGILGVFVTLALLLVYIPQSKDLSDLETRITTRQRKLTDDSERAAVVPDLQRTVNLMKARYRGFDRRLPKRKELGGFLREISGHLVADEKLSNGEIRPGTPTRQELFHTLPIVMKFKGPYLALVALLERIDKMERLTRVQKLTATQTKTGDLDIELQLNIYFTES